jgi:hypothetical protein
MYIAAVAEAGDLVSFINQVETERLTEQIIVVDEKEVASTMALGLSGCQISGANLPSADRWRRP